MYLRVVGGLEVAGIASSVLLRLIFFSNHCFCSSKKEADLVTTHELGHNFGAEHDPDSLPECAPTEDQGGKYVMYPIAVSGDHENNKVKLHNFASTHTSPT